MNGQGAKRQVCLEEPRSEGVGVPGTAKPISHPRVHGSNATNLEAHSRAERLRSLIGPNGAPDDLYRVKSVCILPIEEGGYLRPGSLASEGKPVSTVMDLGFGI